MAIAGIQYQGRLLPVHHHQTLFSVLPPNLLLGRFDGDFTKSLKSFNSAALPRISLHLIGENCHNQINISVTRHYLRLLYLKHRHRLPPGHPRLSWCGFIHSTMYEPMKASLPIPRNSFYINRIAKQRLYSFDVSK